LSAKPRRPASSSREIARRDVLKLGALVGAAIATAPLLSACEALASFAPGSGTPNPGAVAGPITEVLGGGDPRADPTLKTVYDGFLTQHPGASWDFRTISGLGADWDRLARTTVTSGDPIDLIQINGLFVRAWVRDGLLADLGADPNLAAILARVGSQFHLGGPGETTTRAFPLAVTHGVDTTGLYFNKAILDRAGVEVPRTVDDLKALVKPLSALGVAPFVYCSGEISFNSMLMMWLLPMFVGAGTDPIAFVESTIRGDTRYDGPEWLEAMGVVADLRTSGVLLAGSGAVDYGAMQQFLQGKAATTYNGTWVLPSLLAGSPSGPFDLHVAPLPLASGAPKVHSLLAWNGLALPAGGSRPRDAAYAFLDYASRPDVDRAATKGLQAYSPMPASNTEIENTVAKEFLPMFGDAIAPLNWLWEPEVEAELNDQVQSIVKGTTDPRTAASAVQAVADQVRSSGRGYYA
jgi:arabinogalactan oligomer/maltooligosaccharide transport system substrate-binding protein